MIVYQRGPYLFCVKKPAPCQRREIHDRINHADLCSENATVQYPAMGGGSSLHSIFCPWCRQLIEGVYPGFVMEFRHQKRTFLSHFWMMEKGTTRIGVQSVAVHAPNDPVAAAERRMRLSSAITSLSTFSSVHMAPKTWQKNAVC